MTINKRAVFVTTRVAETYHQGTIGFARAVQYARPDLLLDTRKCQRYDFKSNLSRAGALKMEPGMRAVFEGGRLQAEPPTGYEGVWHVIVMLDNDVPVEGEMSSWGDAGWRVFRFDPCWDYPHPLRASTPTEDRSNPVAVDNKIEGLRKQVAEMSQRLIVLEEAENAKQSLYSESTAATATFNEKPSEPEAKQLYRDAEYTTPSTLVWMALSSTEQEMDRGEPTVLLRVTGVRSLGEKVSTEILMLLEHDYRQALRELDEQTDRVPHSPVEAWDLLLNLLQKADVRTTLVRALGADTEKLRSLAKEKFHAAWT